MEQPIADITLEAWTLWLVFGGGAGVITTLGLGLLKKGPKFLAWWDGLVTEVKSLLTYAAAAILGVLGFGLRILMQYQATPTGLPGWVEAVFAIVVSQVVYYGTKFIRRKAQSQAYARRG